MILTYDSFQIISEMQVDSRTPFYKRHLEEYLGSYYSIETYNQLLEEVDIDVERRMKGLFC